MNCIYTFCNLKITDASNPLCSQVWGMHSIWSFSVNSFSYAQICLPEVSFKLPHPFLSRKSVELTNIPQQFSEHWCLCGSESRSEVLQDLLGARLAVHLSLEGHKVPQVNQKLIVFCGGSMHSSRLSLFLILILLSLGLIEVIPGLHSSKERGWGERTRLLLCSFTAEVSSRSWLLNNGLLYNICIL